MGVFFVDGIMWTFFFMHKCVLFCVGFKTLDWKHKELEDGKNKHMSVIGLIRVKLIALHFHIIVWAWEFTKLNVASPQ
jgi:hypothetical protein